MLHALPLFASSSFLMAFASELFLFISCQSKSLKQEFTRIFAISHSLKSLNGTQNFGSFSGSPFLVKRVTRPVDSLPLPRGLMSSMKSSTVSPILVRSLPSADAARLDTRNDLPAWDGPKRPNAGAVPATRSILSASFLTQ